jgi:hypothetical protein
MIDPAVSRRHVRAITESLSPLEVPDKMTVLHNRSVGTDAQRRGGLT